MDLENYTNINIYKRTFEERQVANCHDMIEQPHNHLSAGNVQRRFNPYQNNEGTVVGKFYNLFSGQASPFRLLTKFCFAAIAGADFVTVATDTRMSAGYSILSRTQSKTTKLTDSTILTSAGMVADVETLHKNLLFVIRQYEMQNKRSPSTACIAKKLSVTLYGRRFMPYYAFNLLCGIDESGKGVVYGYDAVGSYDTLTYGVQGSGSQLGAPILDNQFIGHNFKVKVLPQNQQEVENTAKDIINSIAERDIYTGDNVEIVTVDKNGVRTMREPIRRD